MEVECKDSDFRCGWNNYQVRLLTSQHELHYLNFGCCSLLKLETSGGGGGGVLIRVFGELN